ncbi:MAG TPA: hypothetical protein VNW97_08540 [Candidatus Saccharimonadales bacterium]|nr:hypothetical protein [Candidatus Saccharimonadales bacterium]
MAREDPWNQQIHSRSGNNRSSNRNHSSHRIKNRNSRSCGAAKGVRQMKNHDQFHDGVLEGLWIDGTIVHVFLSTLKKERFTAVAEGVVALAANGFRAGNIIFEVLTRGHEEIVSSDIAELYDLQDGPQGENQGMKLLEKAQHEGLTLLEINPSYGGTCLVLAHSINFFASAHVKLIP